MYKCECDYLLARSKIKSTNVYTTIIIHVHILEGTGDQLNSDVMPYLYS